MMIISNVFWAVNQYIRMISEGSRDTEDWSNDAENSALINKVHLNRYSNRKQLFKIAIILLFLKSFELIHSTDVFVTEVKNTKHFHVVYMYN